MKIVYIHQYFNTPDQGGSSRSYEFARRLAQAGHEVHMITTERSGTDGRRGWQVTEMESFTIHRVNVPYAKTMSFRRRVGSFLDFAFRAGPRARALRGDVVFATSTPLTVAIPAIYATALRRTPMVFEIRDLWPEMPIALGILTNRLGIQAARALEHLAYRRSESIVALSEGMKAGVVAAGIDPSRISVIPNAADLEPFGAVERPAVAQWVAKNPHLRGKRMVLYCGSLGKVNGVSYLVDVAKHAQELDDQIVFVTVGTGNDVEEVTAYAARAGVLNRNFFHYAPIAKREVPVLFAASSIALSLFVPVPEMAANSANKFFDSLAAGRPIAINYGGWQKDEILAHSVGLVLPPRDPAEAARLLIQAVHDDSWLAQTGAAARSLAERKYSRSLLAAKLLSLLEEAVGQHRHSREAVGRKASSHPNG